MNKIAIVIGLFVLALSLQGKNKAETVKIENFGLNISGYSKEVAAKSAEKNVAVMERVRFSPTAELKIVEKIIKNYLREEELFKQFLFFYAFLKKQILYRTNSKNENYWKIKKNLSFISEIRNKRLFLLLSTKPRR